MTTVHWVIPCQINQHNTIFLHIPLDFPESCHTSCCQTSLHAKLGITVKFEQDISKFDRDITFLSS